MKSLQKLFFIAALVAAPFVASYASSGWSGSCPCGAECDCEPCNCGH